METFNIRYESAYKKNMPIDKPNTIYLFTENAQALCASHPDWYNNDWIENGFLKGSKVKTGVSDMNGTNQAVIRSSKSNSYGNDSINPNVFGIVVKKYQQFSNYSFAKKEGQFTNSLDDYMLFMNLNNIVFKKMKEYIIEHKITDIVCPTQMATRRSALPYRLAEWLLMKFDEELALDFKVVENNNVDYDGYGLILINK